jgi:hypothetical protein
MSFLLLYALPTQLAPHSRAYRCCVGETVRLSVFSQSIVMMYDWEWCVGGSFLNGSSCADGSFRFEGYMPKLLDLIATETGITFEVVPLSFSRAFVDGYLPLTNGTVNSSFILLTNLVLTSDFDAILSGSYAAPGLLASLGMNTSQVQNISRNEFAYTLPLHNGAWAGLVYKTKTEMTLWRFLDPFEPKLWLATVVTVFVFAALQGLLRLCRAAWDEGANEESGPLGRGPVLGTVDTIYDALVTTSCTTSCPRVTSCSNHPSSSSR